MGNQMTHFTSQIILLHSVQITSFRRRTLGIANDFFLYKRNKFSDISVVYENRFSQITHDGALLRYFYVEAFRILSVVSGKFTVRSRVLCRDIFRISTKTCSYYTQFLHYRQMDVDVIF